MWKGLAASSPRPCCPSPRIPALLSALRALQSCISPLHVTTTFSCKVAPLRRLQLRAYWAFQILGGDPIHASVRPMCDQVSICAIYGAGVADSEVRRLWRLRLRINDPGCTFGGNLQPARVAIFPVGVKLRRQIEPRERRRNKKQTRQLIQGGPKQTTPLRLTSHSFKTHEPNVWFLNAVWFWIHLSTLHLSNL